MDLQMKMPDLATTGSAIRIVRWLVEPGYPVRRGQALVEVETDKAVSQVESIATGLLKETLTRANSLVSAGKVIAIIELKTVEATPPPDLSPKPVAVSPPPAAHFSYKRRFL